MDGEGVLSVSDKRELIALTVSAFANAMGFTYVFSIAGYMAVELLQVSREESGYYAGMVASSQMLGMAMGALGWGRVADKWGRRPVVLIGCIAVALSAFVVGIAESFWVVVVARFVGGLFNAILPTAKTLTAEVCGGRCQTRAMTLLMGAWSFALIISPSLSGIVTRDPPMQTSTSTNTTSVSSMITPTMHAFVSSNDVSFTDRYPFFIASIISSAAGLFSFVWCYYFLPETLVSSYSNATGGATVSSSKTKYQSLRKSSTGSTAYYDTDDDDEIVVRTEANSTTPTTTETQGATDRTQVGEQAATDVMQVAGQLGTVPSSITKYQSLRKSSTGSTADYVTDANNTTTSTRGVKSAVIQVTEELGNTDDGAGVQAADMTQVGKQLGNTDDGVKVDADNNESEGHLGGAPMRWSSKGVWDVDADYTDDVSDNDDDDVDYVEESVEKPVRICSRDVASCLSMYTMWAFLQIYLDETIPLWTIASVSAGGLGFTGTETGSMLGTGGIAMLFGNIVLYPMMARRYTPIGVLWTSTLASSVVVTVMPIATRWAVLNTKSTWIIWVVLGGLNGVRAISFSTAFTCVALINNNAIPNQLRGTVNSIGFLLGCASRVLGPVLGSSAFAWSISASAPLGVNENFLFLSFSVATALIALAVAKGMLHPRLNHKYEERQANGFGSVDGDGQEMTELHVLVK